MKLFVGNLPFSMTNDDLREVFEGAGFEVNSASVVADRETQRSRGFGFVETPQGDAAIEAVSRLTVGGRSLTVNEARPMTNDRGPRTGGGRRDRY